MISTILRDLLQALILHHAKMGERLGIVSNLFSLSGSGAGKRPD
jgi:hypothetical protein